MAKHIGTSDADTITGTPADDKLIGLEGDDSIVGGDGADRIYGNNGDDVLRGEGGDDFLTGGENNDTIDGGAGVDTVSFGGLLDPIGVVVSLRDGIATGGDGSDVLISIENVSGSQFADDITGDSGDNELVGKGGHDTLKGGKGNDVLLGDAGDDVLVGGAGMDTLWGSKGQDQLTGGDGADTFFYQTIGGTRGEQINDLTAEDFIDLSMIDADANTGGDQAFTLVDAFSGTAGELWVKYSATKDVTLIRGDIDGDGVKDFQIEASGDVSDYTNFVL